MQDLQFDYDHLEYDTPERLYSYGFQLQEIFDYSPRGENLKVLNIGKGGGFLKQYLTARWGMGGAVYDVDVYAPLQPDVYSDVRWLAFADNSMDLVACCQVLQYIPFGELPLALAEINRVIKPGGRAIISMPDDCGYAYLRARLPRLSFFKILSLPLGSRKVEARSQKKYPDYWEINRKGCSSARVRLAIARHFSLIKDYRLPKHPYHHFFIMSKDEGGQY